MATYTNLSDFLTDTADAIRAKDGTSDTITAGDIPTRISAITTGSDTGDATVTASDLREGVIAYGQTGKVTGTMADNTITVSSISVSSSGTCTCTATNSGGYAEANQSKSVSTGLTTVTPGTPTISVNSSGVITASATTSQGYVTSSAAGTKSSTKTLSTASIGSIVMTDNDGSVSASCTIGAGYNASSVTKTNSLSLSSLTLDTPTISINSSTGLITATGSCGGGYSPGVQSLSTTAYAYDYDSDFVASNIKSGVTILGVTGTYVGVSGYQVNCDGTARDTSVPSGYYYFAGTLSSGDDGNNGMDYLFCDGTYEALLSYSSSSKMFDYDATKYATQLYVNSSHYISIYSSSHWSSSYDLSIVMGYLWQ